MKHIFLLVICVAIGSALIGSFLFQFFTPNTNSDLEAKCVRIATEAYQIQLNYPTLELHELPEEDKNRIIYLNDLWFRDCVSNFSQEKILNIAQQVENNYFSGE